MLLQVSKLNREALSSPNGVQGLRSRRVLKTSVGPQWYLLVSCRKSNVKLLNLYDCKQQQQQFYVALGQIKC